MPSLSAATKARILSPLLLAVLAWSASGARAAQAPKPTIGPDAREWSIPFVMYHALKDYDQAMKRAKHPYANVAIVATRDTVKLYNKLDQSYIYCWLTHKATGDEPSCTFSPG